MSKAPPSARAGSPPRYAAYLTLPDIPFLPGNGRPRPALFLPGLGEPAWPDLPLHRDPAFREGVDLYHLGYWWEAHEHWEASWRRASRADPVHALLSGAILLSASHLKRMQGLPTGAVRLLERSLARLEQAAHYPGAAAGGSAGLDVKELLAEVRVWSARQSALAWSATTEARRTELLERMPLIRLPD